MKTLTRKDLCVGDRVLLTARDGVDAMVKLPGRVSIQSPDKTVVFVSTYSWFEFTDQSDIEVRARDHIHING